MTTDTLNSIRELTSRMSGTDQIRLLWRQEDGLLWVTVRDSRTGETFCIDVREHEPPLDVFQHPYAYAAHHGIDPSVDRPRGEPAIP